MSLFKRKQEPVVTTKSRPERGQVVFHGSYKGKCDRCCHLAFAMRGKHNNAYTQAVCVYPALNEHVRDGKPLNDSPDKLTDTTTPKWCPMKHTEDWG